MLRANLASRGVADLAHVLWDDSLRIRLAAGTSAVGVDAVERVDLDIVAGHPSLAVGIVSIVHSVWGYWTR
jgi:hypothetical protein